MYTHVCVRIRKCICERDTQAQDIRCHAQVCSPKKSNQWLDLTAP